MTNDPNTPQVQHVVTNEPNTPQGAEYNVIADFADGADARAAILGLERSGVEAARISLLGVAEERTERLQGTGMWRKDKAMTRRVGSRVATGAVIGAPIGALLGWVIAVGFTDLASGSLVLAALGGAIVGVLLGGLGGGYAVAAAGAQPGRETYGLDDSGSAAQLAVHTDDEDEFDRALQALNASGATLLSRLDRQGRTIHT